MGSQINPCRTSYWSSSWKEYSDSNWHHYLTRYELANTHWRDNHESF